MTDPYEEKVAAIIGKLADLAVALQLDIRPDDDRQPTLDEVEAIIDDLIEQAER